MSLESREVERGFGLAARAAGAARVFLEDGAILILLQESIVTGQLNGQCKLIGRR